MNECEPAKEDDGQRVLFFEPLKRDRPHRHHVMRVLVAGSFCNILKIEILALAGLVVGQKFGGSLAGLLHVRTSEIHRKRQIAKLFDQLKSGRIYVGRGCNFLAHQKCQRRICIHCHLVQVDGGCSEVGNSISGGDDDVAVAGCWEIFGDSNGIVVGIVEHQ